MTFRLNHELGQERNIYLDLNDLKLAIASNDSAELCEYYRIVVVAWAEEVSAKDFARLTRRNALRATRREESVNVNCETKEYM